jgi:GNAT superfamily N-acetyltransferase
VATLRPPVTVQPAEPDEHFDGILGLYRAHGWIHATDPERLRTAIACSSTSLVALQGDAVVGFARALSDEAFAVYIADILVHPDRQREGIGSALFHALLERYPIDVFHHQVLVSERGAEGFYRRHGLTPIGAYGLTAFIRSRDVS